MPQLVQPVIYLQGITDRRQCAYILHKHAVIMEGTMGGTGFLVLEDKQFFEGVYFGNQDKAVGEDDDIVQIREYKLDNPIEK